MTMQRATSRGWLLLAACGVLALTGCKSTQPTAFQIMQEQQQLQAQARQAEDESTRKSLPTQPEMLMSLVAEAQAQNRHFAALAYVDAYIQQFGATPEIAPLRANALRMTGQAQASEQIYRSLLSGPRAAEGWHGLGLLAGARGDFETASDALSKAAKLQPTDADILSDLGYARLRAGDLAGARLPLGQAAELNPASVKVVANLALLLLVEGDVGRADQVMTQVNMSEQARAQLLQLAQQTRLPPKPMPVPLAKTDAGATSGATVRFIDAATQQVAPVTPEVAARPANVAASRSTPSGAAPTAMLPPLMDLLGNTPLVR